MAVLQLLVLKRQNLKMIDKKIRKAKNYDKLTQKKRSMAGENGKVQQKDSRAENFALLFFDVQDHKHLNKILQKLGDCGIFIKKRKKE